MVDFRYTLPFPRGKTMSDGMTTIGTSTTTQAAYWENLCGRVFEVLDERHDADSGDTVKLRVVRNHVTALTISHKAVAFTTAEGEWGKYVSGYAAGQGVMAKPMDDVYTAGGTIPCGDLFYVVEAGPCDIMNTSSATEAAAWALGVTVTTDAAGRLDGAAAADNDWILGFVDETVTTTTTEMRIVVKEGFNKLETA